VTGTDGKSTVTWLIAETLSQLLPHNPIHITGNFDEPMGKTILHILQANQQSQPHVFVIECSSFMLYPTKMYLFDCAVWTNFAPDHLNRHPSMDEYFAAKQRLFIGSKANFTSQDIFDKLLPALQSKTHMYGEDYDLSKTHFI
jgi:UDP-N-acetylmuramoylalanine--D-glutamate ligase